MSEGMKAHWEKYAGWFNARILRERIIIALCIIAALYFVWDFAVLQGLAAKRNALDSRYQLATSDMTKLSAEERVLSQALLNNPNAKKQREILQLEARLKKLDEEIEALSVGLVSAEKLPRAIREVLLSRNDLSLVGFQAYEPEQLRLTANTLEDESVFDESLIDTTIRERDSVGVYKHRVALRIEGSYFAIRDYLYELEESEWHFYWSSLDYSVGAHPKATAQIEVYTLSTDRGFIGGVSKNEGK